MTAPINAAALARLAEEPLDWRFKGLPAPWWGRTPADVCAESPRLLAGGAVGPVCILLADALAANLATMAQWCNERGVELAAALHIPDDPSQLSFLLTGIVQIDPATRQALLEADSAEARLRDLDRLLDRELSLLDKRLAPFQADRRTLLTSVN